MRAAILAAFVLAAGCHFDWDRFRGPGTPPGPSTTGIPPGTVLRPSGSLVIQEDGAVLEDLEVNGTLKIDADDVTVRRVRVTSAEVFVFEVYEGHRNAVFEDIECNGQEPCVTCVLGFNTTVRRADLHGCIDGVRLNAGSSLEDSYIHDLLDDPARSRPHGQFTLGTLSGVSFLRNRIENVTSNLSGSSCIGFGASGGPGASDVLVEGNVLDGGYYTLVFDSSGTNRVVRGNRFGRGFAQGLLFSGGAVTWENNVWDDTGAPANP